MDDGGFHRTVDDLMRIWVNPEIERRKERGVLPPDFRLSACQVLFPSPLDVNRAKRVLLNDEVKIELLARTSRTCQLGDIVTTDDVEAIEGARLPPDEENSGHISLLRLSDTWFLTFDCRYNKARIRECLSAAREFIDVAEMALRSDRLRPACDLLFSGAELLANAELLHIPLAVPKGHTGVSTRLNGWVRLGNAPRTTATNLGQLSRLRDRARYLKSPLKVTSEKLSSILGDLRDEASRVEQRFLA